MSSYLVWGNENKTHDLHYCYWCGKKPKYQIYYLHNEADRHSITCPCGCYVHGDKSSSSIDIKNEWNEGRIVIPLTVVLPESHYIMEKTIGKQGYPRTANFKIVIYNRRNIAHRFIERLSIIISSSGEIHPFLFTLRSKVCIHFRTQLKSVNKVNTQTIFEFESQNADNCAILTKSKIDTAWLNENIEKPPIYDHIYNLLT